MSVKAINLWHQAQSHSRRFGPTATATATGTVIDKDLKDLRTSEKFRCERSGSTQSCDLGSIQKFVDKNKEKITHTKNLVNNF